MCDSCDGARDIIEQDDKPRWDKITHYFMDHDDKEVAKRVLGFKQVPFYVVLDKEGDIVQMGSKKHIDFDNIPGVIKEEAKSDGSGTNDNSNGAFEILDLDF